MTINRSLDENQLVFPVSFAQQQLWLLDQLESVSPLYTIFRAFSLTGPLNVPALEASFNELVRRHEALRTTFRVVEGELAQCIAQENSFLLPLVDLEDLPAERQESAVRRRIDEEYQRPFDLETGPLVRLRLLRLGKEKHVLMLVVHHIIADGWSLRMLYQELSAFYAARVRGTSLSLPPLSIQYADFAVWQREWLQGEALEAELAYWKARLSWLPPLQLPTDHLRPPVQTFRGQLYTFPLERTLAQDFIAFSRQEGLTLFIVALAAFLVLLSRYTRQTSIVIGTSVANRTQAEVEGLIGNFANVLTLLAEVSPELSFRELLGRVREIALEAYMHQGLPFEKLVQELNPQRTTDRNPLFQVVFRLENNSVAGPELTEIQVSPIEVKRTTSKFDLTVLLEHSQQLGLQGTIEYSTSLFEEATIQRMAGHFQILLRGIVAHPEQPLREFPLLTSAERQQLLIDWNQTRTPYPAEQSIAEVFEAQVARSPRATALILEGQQLSYQELNAHANQLAHRLQRLGVAPEVCVGICLDRSIELVVAILAILKAGGVYVPLDPTTPAERLAFMLQDARVSVLLTHSSLRSLLPTIQEIQLLCLDQEVQTLQQESEHNPERKVGPEHLAYIMYTSGSTGRPKGVQIQQASVLRLVLGANYARLDASRTLLHLAPIAFDASTFELWGALLQGGCCVLLPERIPTPHSIGRLVQRYQITTMFLTTSLFNALIEEAPEVLQGVEEVLVGGEALSVYHIRRAQALLPQTCLSNVYGPTESTTFTCLYSIPNPLSEEVRSIPIGRPIGNTQVYILDQALNPAPVGVPGELYIGGDGLARGYLNHPELTAEAFLPHPFSEEPGTRLYKTGDLVRYLPDGAIEFLGRLDQQVKLRGFRIEPGEIETLLMQQEEVKEAVVLLREDIPGEPQLVAYIVGQAEIHHVRQQLETCLPDYMIPSLFIPLEAIPLTSNGKVDRRALLALRPAPQEERPTHSRPQTQLEQLIASLWQELLHREAVGRDENFFDLGGYSLLMVRLHQRLCTALNREISMLDLFEYPSIASLASHLSQNAEEGSGEFSPPKEERKLVAVEEQRLRREKYRAGVQQQGGSDE